MRDAFAQELESLAAEDARIVLLSGDIGNRMFDRFKARFANRFYNCGVAEANMMSLAAGMALCGLRPVVYTIAPFVTTRCLEQIRVDVCYHGAAVTIVGVGGGLSYASLGTTHHACEDIGFLRLLPGMTVVCPGDPLEVRAAFRAAIRHPGPVYIRLGKKGEPCLHEGLPHFELGRGIVLHEGGDVWLLSTGNMLAASLEAARRLGELGVSTGVVSLHTIKPLDEPLLERVFQQAQLVVTLEEHSVLGGLGGAVAEWRADREPVRARLLRLGTPDEFLHQVGSQEYLRRILGLDVPAIAARIRAAYRAACRTEVRS